MKKKVNIKAPSKKEIDIFERVFLYAIEIPSFRWKMKRMIKSCDRVDFAEVNLKLKRLEIELAQKNGGEKND